MTALDRLFSSCLVSVRSGVLLVAAAGPAAAETVEVKYRGPVDLAPFTCAELTRSSFIQSVCYDTLKSYMLIQLSGVWYHYCAIDAVTVAELQGAPSMGTYYKERIRSKGSTHGPFDCRDHLVPEYP